MTDRGAPGSGTRSPSASPPLAGRRAAVVGVESAAGAAISRALGSAGADVALCALRPDEGVLVARRVQRELTGAGRRAATYVMDVTLGRNVQVTTRQIAKELGGLDLVVSAPQFPRGGSLARLAEVELAQLWALNFTAHLFLVRSAAPELVRAGGGSLLLLTHEAGSGGGGRGARRHLARLASRGRRRAGRGGGGGACGRARRGTRLARRRRLRTHRPGRCRPRPRRRAGGALAVSLPAFDLSGRAAIVTGAGGGFGREIALSLARVGCDVVAAGRREAPLARVAADVRELGRRVLVVPTDVTDSAQVNALVAETMAEWGRIDVLVNNAGSYTGIAGGSLPELTDEEERARLGERQVAGRVGRPQEVGPLVAFLASDAAAYLNGATISLDGGAAAGGLVPAGIDAGRAAPTGRGAP